MANEGLNTAFEILELGNIAWMVSSSINSLPENKKNLAKTVDSIMDSFSLTLDFVDNIIVYQPLGLTPLPKSKSTLGNRKLLESAKLLKSVASNKKSKDYVLKANKVLKVFEITSSYLKNREFFENKSAKLNSSSPYGQFKG
jgi:arginine/ornithine N-succinyltransferase beta subunit